jgi:hypothetical protein
MIIRGARKVLGEGAWPFRICIGLVYLAVFAAFWIGVQRDFHSRIGLGNWGRMVFAIGAAITELEHGGYGYVTSGVMDTVLQFAGLTSNPAILDTLGLKAPENFQNTSLINTAIQKAVEFKWNFNPNNVEEVRGAYNDDVGFIEYVKLSFRLFGYNVTSFYLTYFLLLMLSVTIFIFSFGKRTAPCGLLAVVALAHVGVFASEVFATETVADARFLSTLAIIPALHIGLFIVEGRRPSVVAVVSIGLQSGILAFVFLIRATAAWALLALFLLSAGLTITLWKENRVAAMRYFWSIGIVFSLLAAATLYVQASLHPRYQAKGELTHHVVWHAVFASLQHNPAWFTKYASKFGNAQGDELPYMAAKLYLVKHPPANPEEIYLTPDREYLRGATAETYVRKAFLELLWSDPGFVAETFLFYIPCGAYRTVWPLVTSLGRIPLQYLLVAFMVLSYLSWLFARDEAERRCFTVGLLVLTGFCFFSLLPLLAVPSSAGASDPFYLLVAAALGCSVLVLSRVIGSVRYVVRSRRFRGDSATHAAERKEDLHTRVRPWHHQIDEERARACVGRAGSLPRELRIRSLSWGPAAVVQGRKRRFAELAGQWGKSFIRMWQSCGRRSAVRHSNDSCHNACRN